MARISLLYVPFILCLTSCFIACDSGIDGNTDRQVRLRFDFGADGYSWRDTTWFTTRPSSYLIHFDKRNYGNVDSIVLSVALQAHDSATSSIVELYNITDDIPIVGSQLSVKGAETVWVESPNLYPFLPDKDITLALRMKSSVTNNRASLNRAVLLLYRE